jgi:hypothetical protein
MVGGSVMNLGYGIDILEVCFNDSKTTNKKTRPEIVQQSYNSKRAGANLIKIKRR